MKVLYVDEVRTIGELLKSRLSPARRTARDGTRYELHITDDYEAARGMLLDPDLYDVVIIETSTGGRPSSIARDIIESLNGKRTITIILTSLPSLPDCIESMRRGAWDYIGKLHSIDQITQQLTESIDRAYEKRPANCADPDALYVDRNFRKLAERHPGRWIAVGDGRFLDAAETYEKLVSQVAQIPVPQPKFWRMPPRSDD